MFNLLSLEKETLVSLQACQSIISKRELSLSKQDYLELIDTKHNILNDLQRIDFQSQIIETIITTFYDLDFYNQNNFKESIQELIELYYIFKEETYDEYDDETIIQYLYQATIHSEGILDIVKCDYLEYMIESLHANRDPFEVFYDKY